MRIPDILYVKQLNFSMKKYTLISFRKILIIAKLLVIIFFIRL